ncbi:MAG: hypothetical protein ACRCTL_01690 [Pseudomonas sp.]
MSKQPTWEEIAVMYVEIADCRLEADIIKEVLTEYLPKVSLVREALTYCLSEADTADCQQKINFIKEVYSYCRSEIDVSAYLRSEVDIDNWRLESDIDKGILTDYISRADLVREALTYCRPEYDFADCQSRVNSVKETLDDFFERMEADYKRNDA